MKLGEKEIRNRNFHLSTVNQSMNKIKDWLTCVATSISNLKNNTYKVKLLDNKVRVINQNDYYKELKIVENKLDEVKKAINEKEIIKIENKQIEFDKVVKAINQINIPETKEIDLSMVIRGLEQVRKQIAAIPKPEKINIPKTEKVLFPSKFSWEEAKDVIGQIRILQDLIKNLPEKMPKQEKMKELNIIPVLKELKKVQQAIENIPQFPKIEFPDEISINNFPVQKYPNPVTNININPLRGFVHTTNTTVFNTVTQLPGYGVLSNRRALIFQNVGTVDAYIGGSTVTTSSGYLLEAGGISPSFDSGELQRWYGITASGSTNIRCIELANDRGR